MELSGFRVSIHSDGEELKGYSVEVSPDGKKTTCWVPSQSGKAFVVRYKIGKSSVSQDRAKSVHLYVDGYRMRKCASLPDETGGEVDGVRTSNNTRRPFVFSDIRTTDEDIDFDGTRVNSNEIGTICVRIFLAESWRRLSDSSSSRYRIQNHPPAVISERTKKVAEHCVSARSRYSTVYDSQKPDLVFEFRYRSIGMLQALGIIPPPKREALSIIDAEDKDILPSPKRQKGEHNEDLIQSMQAELDRLRHRVDELEGKKGVPSDVKKEVIKRDPVDIIDLT